LRVRDLSKHYLLPGNKQFKALNAVSFDLQDGRTLGIVGESGCGKSTLARTLMRLVDATGGTVEFGGVSWIATGCTTRPRAPALDADGVPGSVLVAQPETLHRRGGP
jgi:ABC-type oligopeptide transport system ATPase subunit